jgi:hypothetical protein
MCLDVRGRALFAFAVVVVVAAAVVVELIGKR